MVGVSSPTGPGFSRRPGRRRIFTLHTLQTTAHPLVISLCNRSQTREHRAVELPERRAADDGRRPSASIPFITRPY